MTIFELAHGQSHLFYNKPLVSGLMLLIPKDLKLA